MNAEFPKSWQSLRTQEAPEISSGHREQSPNPLPSPGRCASGAPCTRAQRTLRRSFPGRGSSPSFRTGPLSCRGEEASEEQRFPFRGHLPCRGAAPGARSPGRVSPPPPPRLCSCPAALGQDEPRALAQQLCCGMKLARLLPRPRRRGVSWQRAARFRFRGGRRDGGRR